MESAGPFALLTASMRACTVVSRGSYVTIASWPSSATLAGETPFTSSSADRTAPMQPSQIMPSTVSVTVESDCCDRSGWERSLRPQAMSVAIPIAASSARLVVSVFMFSPLLRTASRHAELGELRGDRLAVGPRTHQFVDVEDPTVDADIERLSGWKRLVRIDHTIRQSDASVRIAQERIVEAKRLSEGLVRVRRVNADGEVRHVKRADVIATLTE